MRVIMMSLVVVLLVGVVALLAVLRRGGGGSELVSSELRRVSPPALPPSSFVGQPSSVGPARPLPPDAVAAPGVGLLDGLDAVLRHRVVKLVARNRRVEAINAVRDATGCRLVEAKDVVDRLARRPAPPPTPARPYAGLPPSPAPRAESGGRGARPARQFPPGFDLDPRRLHRPDGTPPTDRIQN